MLLLAGNGEDLIVGRRYLALRFGVTRDGYGNPLKDIFVATLAGSPNGKYPLGSACLVVNGYGQAVGMAQRIVQPDGSVKCVVTGACTGDEAGCSSSSVPGAPTPITPTTPPTSPPTPPSPTPTSYDVWVGVYENHSDPTTHVCGSGTQPGTYTVTVTGATPSSHVVPSGGYWFNNVPWGTDTTATLSYSGGGTVSYYVGNLGGSCGGSGSTGFGTSCTINGHSCDNIAVTFTIGDCGGTPPPALTDITAVKTA
jgi:hypothetical protein